jgi:hypothetical protein
MRHTPYTKTRKQHQRAGTTPPILDREHPLSAMENQPGVLHCDDCERGADLHAQWRSVDGFPLRVLCARHLEHER